MRGGGTGGCCHHFFAMSEKKSTPRSRFTPTPHPVMKLPPKDVLLAIGPLGLGAAATITALVFFAIPPILTSAHTGVREVDPDVVEAARGMGMAGPAVTQCAICAIPGSPGRDSHATPQGATR